MILNCDIVHDQCFSYRSCSVDLSTGLLNASLVLSKILVTNGILLLSTDDTKNLYYLQLRNGICLSP